MVKIRKERDNGKTAPDPFALSREFFFLSREVATAGFFAFPWAIGKSWVKNSGLDPVWNEARVLEILGDTLLRCVNNLGPIYGKFSQLVLTRANSQKLNPHLHLDRLLHSWPALPYSEVEALLDAQIPEWRQEFIIDRAPLGVASMAQVHAAVDEHGREWVIKIIKPEARQRLDESISAIEQLLFLMKPLRISAAVRRFYDESETLLKALRREARPDAEKRNLLRMRQKWEGKKHDALRLPKTHDRFCTDDILVIERFRGIPMSDVIEGRAKLSELQRKRLAKQVLQELLVQVFENGLFHGDPHAGNLILLEDGAVGLFDWGLTGELSDTDRRHISGILKALMGGDVDRLTGELLELAHDSDPDITRTALVAEMKKVQSLFNEEGHPSLIDMSEACLQSCENLKIRVPDGLLLMLKSLLTIEGLAKGIDPELSFSRAAGPILLNAAKPNVHDLWGMSRKIPSLMKKVLAS